MKRQIKNVVKKLPYLRQLFLDIDRLRAELDKYKAGQTRMYVPPGHFHSPIPSIEEVKLNEAKIFDRIKKELPGIDLNEEEQIFLFNQLMEYYNEQPFAPHKKPNLRYFFENPSYSYSDAIFLYCMIRYTRPAKIIEVGGGYSSCVILDTNELYFNNTISCTFIDPYPELLLSLIKEIDKDRNEIIQKKLQDVDLSKFSELSTGDILFIDSTHVSKVGSDVNYIFFEILPKLKSGVYIHFHDIAYPFEYPKEWIYEGRAWNEAYLLRAFLQYNNSFRIQLFNTFLESVHEDKDKLTKQMPLIMKNPGGSIWLKKIT